MKKHMDEYNKNNSNDLTIESIRISYQGVEGENEVRSLSEEIYQRLHLKINPPTKITDRIVRLGVSEILITIILTAIAKDMWDRILNLLQEHFQNQEKIRANKGQIIIKLNDSDTGKRFPFHEYTNWEDFLKAVDKYREEREDKSLIDLIEERVKIDEEISRLFEKEATFLDIDVVSSKKLREEEPDLIISTYSFEQYYKYIKEKVEENHGKVLNACGDEVMAWFELPDNAISCALAIFKWRDDFNKRRNKLKNSFQFRIGINTGVALIDEQRGKAFSKGVLDLAGHLQKEAEPGIFLISENTYSTLKTMPNFQRYKYIKRDKIWGYKIIDNKQQGNKSRK